MSIGWDRCYRHAKRAKEIFALMDRGVQKAKSAKKPVSELLLTNSPKSIVTSPPPSSHR